MSFSPTPEQQAILRAARDESDSIMITAYAGCAKTTTLELIANNVAVPSALALAFNVKIKKELEKRFPSNFRIMTMNGLGHVAWGRAIGKPLTLDERKLGKIVTAVCKEEGFEPSTDDWSMIRTLASKAMLNGMVPEGYPQAGLIPDRDDIWELIAEDEDCYNRVLIHFARQVIRENVKQAFAGVISFDDQIYMSTMFNGVFPRFPLVMVDEAQDLSPLNHIQVQRAAAGRLIVVGDPKQAIYQFRGADSESMSKLRKLRSAWIDLPLATTFRCPKIIVGRQSRHAPGFTAFPTNIEGEVLTMPLAPPPGSPPPEGWNYADIDNLAEGHSVAILCRNNAPLLDMAFKLIKSSVSCVMLGRDIGKGLIALSKKILPQDDTPALACLRLIEDWRIAEIALARANDKEHRVAGIEDRADCLCAVVESGRAGTAGELRKFIELLFARDKGKVTLSTGHRAKGLEWDIVVHLDPWRIPSRYAQHNPVQMEQEKNLLYVIETRAKQKLIMANLEDYSA